MPRPPHHHCEFTYDYRPVGQGLFCRGELVFRERNHPRKIFQWVYDCGSENRDIVNGEVDLYRRHPVSYTHLRQLEHDETFYEKPAVTLDRLHRLEKSAEADVMALEKMLKA